MDNAIYTGTPISTTPPSGFNAPAEVVAVAGAGVHSYASLRDNDSDTRSHLAAFVMSADGTQVEQRFTIRSATTPSGPVFQIYMGNEPEAGGTPVLSIDMSGNVTIAGNLIQNSLPAGSSPAAGR
ncbi:MAG: hypothetical protein U0359_27755 [Byssovorax sp.]